MDRQIQRLRLICHLEVRRKGNRGLGFKGEVGNSQVDGKEQTSGKQILAGPLRISGEQRSSRNTLRLAPHCLRFILK